MTDYNTNLKDWGATGSEYPDGYNYDAPEPPVDEYDNWVMDNIITDLQHLTSLTSDRIESDKGTSRPSSPENAHLFSDTNSGDLEWYDPTTSSWRRALDATGDTMEGGLTLNSGANLGGNLTDSNSNTIWDYSAGYVPQSSLENNSLTVAGNSVSLGGSTSISYGDLSNSPISHSDLSDAPPSAHHTRYADSEAVSAINAETSLDVDITGDADTIDGKHATDLGVTVEDDGTVVYESSTGVNFGTGINVTDDNDGTVTVSAASTISQLTIDADKDWGNYDISNVRKLSAEDGVINGKTLETNENMTIKSDESMVVSESYTVEDGADLTIENGGSLTVM